MERFRSLVLPFAIVVGLMFHSWCALLSQWVPYIIFAILLLNYVAVPLRNLRVGRLDLWLMIFQITVSLGGYLLVRLLIHNELLAQGILIGVLCPVAASVVVIACMLGANREVTTSYAILGNLMISFVAPIYFSFIGIHQDMPFIESFLLIFKKISPIIALPFFITLFLQLVLPKVNNFLKKYSKASFYLWAVALCLTLGKTIHFIYEHGKGNEKNIVLLGLSSICACAIQFAIGKWIGRHYGDTIAGGQLLGQKNTAIGIWMANTYLEPLASVFPALYSIWQNLFNSWQLWRHEHKKR